MSVRRHGGVELQDVPFSGPQKILEAVPKLVSSKVGLIRQVTFGLHMAQDPGWLAMGAACADLDRVLDIRNSDKAGGSGESFELALAASVGEAVERYCTLFYDKSDMVLAPYREVAADALSPEILRLYSEEQVVNKPDHIRLAYFDEDTVIRWTWGYSLTHRRPRLVPATQVYLHYTLDDEELSSGRNASTGLAAGSTLEEAILTGLLEVIERDAFTIAWLHRKVGPRWRVDDPEREEMIRRRFHTDHPGVDLQFYDISLDLPIHSVFGLLRREAEFGPALCVSSVSRLNPADALRKSMRELGQGLPYIRFLLDQLSDWEPAADFSDLTTFDHHYTLYSKKPELMPAALSFCDQVTEEVALSELPNRSTGRVKGDVELCIEMLSGIDKEVIVVDLTTPEIMDLGLHVVRVMVPGLVPLHGNHSFPYLGVRRLHELPSRLGWEKKGWDPDAGFNPYPHPFP